MLPQVRSFFFFYSYLNFRYDCPILKLSFREYVFIWTFPLCQTQKGVEAFSDKSNTCFIVPTTSQWRGEMYHVTRCLPPLAWLCAAPSIFPSSLFRHYLFPRPLMVNKVSGEHHLSSLHCCNILDLTLLAHQPLFMGWSGWGTSHSFHVGNSLFSCFKLFFWSKEITVQFKKN